MAGTDWKKAKERAYEAYLVAAARTGQQAAFSRLVAFRGPRLFAHASRLLGNTEEARDAVQESWLQIARALPQLRDVTAFAPFAYRIVTRQCARQIGRNVRERAIARDIDAMEGPANVPDTGENPVDGLGAAIERLPPLQAATIRLFYLEEYSLREVAQAMDVPVGTVKSRLAKARARLRTTLEGENDEQH